MLEQTVREAAGAGTGIQADQAAHIQIEVVQNGQQLVGTAADVALLFQQHKGGGFGIGMAGLVHQEGRRSGRQALGREGHLASHDEAAGLFAAFGKSLGMHKGIGPQAGHLGTGRSGSGLRS